MPDAPSDSPDTSSISAALGEADPYEKYAELVDLRDLDQVRRHVFTANPREWPKPLLYALLDRVEAVQRENAALREALTLWEDEVPTRMANGDCWWCGCHWNSNGGHYDFCKRPAAALAPSTPKENENG